jgi:hypothetical protein
MKSASCEDHMHSQMNLWRYTTSPALLSPTLFSLQRPNLQSVPYTFHLFY